jgi:hypothetical protein
VKLPAPTRKLAEKSDLDTMACTILTGPITLNFSEFQFTIDKFQPYTWPAFSVKRGFAMRLTLAFLALVFISSASDEPLLLKNPH